MKELLSTKWWDKFDYELYLRYLEAKLKVEQHGN
jgi:hypothetical protein